MSGTQFVQRPTPTRDRTAGALLQQLREKKGLSREQLPHAMLFAGVPREHIPSVKTIYNVEVHGQIPRVRLKFGFAQFFERDMHQVWAAPRLRVAA